MPYQLYTKNQLGEIVAVTPGIDERVSNLETKAIELDLNKLDIRQQTLTEEQKAQVVQNLEGTFIPIGSAMENESKISPYSDFLNVGFDYDLLKGAVLTLRRYDYSSNPGGFQLLARNSTNTSELTGYANGVLTWNNFTVENVSTVQHNCIRYNSGLQICWGVGLSDRNITFSAPFRDTAYSVVCMVKAIQGSNTAGYTQGTVVSNTSFYVRTRTADDKIWSDNCYWIAVGFWK